MRKNYNYISCFTIDEFFPLPDIFYGKWIQDGSIHFPGCDLKINCAQNEKGASLMTREQAIKDAKKWQEICINLLNMASEDWSYSFKNKKNRR